MTLASGIAAAAVGRYTGRQTVSQLSSCADWLSEEEDTWPLTTWLVVGSCSEQPVSYSEIELFKTAEHKPPAKGERMAERVLRQTGSLSR